MASLASPIRIGDRRAKALPASPTRVGLRVRKPAFGTELCAHHAAFPQRKPGFPHALDPRDDLYAGNSRTRTELMRQRKQVGPFPDAHSELTELCVEN